MKSNALWMGMVNEARIRMGWSTVVAMGNYKYIKIGDKEFGLREWTDNIEKTVWREVIQNVLYGHRGNPVIYTCLENYRNGERICQWSW